MNVALGQWFGGSLINVAGYVNVFFLPQDLPQSAVLQKAQEEATRVPSEMLESS